MSSATCSAGPSIDRFTIRGHIQRTQQGAIPGSDDGVNGEDFVEPGCVAGGRPPGDVPLGQVDAVGTCCGRQPRGRHGPTFVTHHRSKHHDRALYGHDDHTGITEPSPLHVGLGRLEGESSRKATSRSGNPFLRRVGKAHLGHVLHLLAPSCQLGSGDPERDPEQVREGIANLPAARHGARERLGHRVIRHVPATAREAVDGSPERGAVGPPDLVEIVGALHSVTMTERSRARKVNDTR